MSIERQAVSALKWSAISKVLGQLVSWGATLVVIRLLSPDDYGLMAISVVIVTIFSGIAELGLGASIVQSGTISKTDLEKLAGALLLLNLGLGLLVVLAAPLAGVVFNDSRLIDVVRVLAVQFLFNAAAAIPASMAYRQMRFKLLAYVDLASALVASMATVALAWWGAGVWALVLGMLLGAASRTTLLLVRVGGVWPSFAFRGIGHYLTFGGKMTVARMAWQIGYQADILIAGRFLTKEALGIYSVSLHLATLPVDKLMGILNSVTFPTVARMQDDLPRVRARLLDASRILGFAAIPVLWGISAVSPEFVALALGERWLDAILPLQVVTLVLPLRILSVMLTTSVSALGRVDIDMRNKLVNCAVLPIAFLVGVQWGLEGLALTWVIAHPVLFLENFPGMSRVLGIDLGEIGKAVYGPIVAGIAMYGAVWGARPMLGFAPEAYQLVALIMVGAATYLSVAALLDRRIWGDLRRLAAALKD